MGSAYVGIDLGTSALKIILIDDQRRILRQTTREYELSNPHTGWSEINPEVWYAQMLSGMEELLSGGLAADVAAIGVTGQMHTLVTLDEEGAPVRPAIMWNDLRTKGMLQELRDKIALFDNGGHLADMISTGSPAANLYWMKKEEPEQFRRVRHFLIGPDYLVCRLTGTFGTDFCEASTSSLYRIDKRCWSEEMRSFLGLPESVYPSVRGSAQRAGVVLPELCGRLGLRGDVTVAIGTGDNPASAISTGCLGQGYPVLSLGTSGVLMAPILTTDDAAKGKVILFSEDGRHFLHLVQGVVQSNGEGINWIAKKILGREDLNGLTESLERRMEELPEGKSFAEGLLYFPHLSGDKTVYADPDLRGAFIGLSSETTPEELFFAVIEGLCLAVRELADKMKISFPQNSLKVVGGGTRSRVWMQTLSDVLNLRIEKVEGQIGPGLGAALLAMTCVQSGCSLESLTRHALKVESVFFPEEGKRAYYQEKYARYLRIRDAVKYIEEPIGSPLVKVCGAEES